jgi:hypothetical protein
MLLQLRVKPSILAASPTPSPVDPKATDPSLGDAAEKAEFLRDNGIQPAQPPRHETPDDEKGFIRRI